MGAIESCNGNQRHELERNPALTRRDAQRQADKRSSDCNGLIQYDPWS